jgi:uracil-xanthine permease
MALLSWKVVHDGKTPPPGEVVRPDERMSWPRTTGIGIQHVLAMFGATFVLPPIMGIPGTTAVFFSGIGTLIFLVFVRNRIPSYLGTSAAFIGPAFAVYNGGGDLSEVLFGVLSAGVIFFVIGALVNAGGQHVIAAILPPVLTGTVVMLIGLNLAGPVANNAYWKNDQWLALVTLTITILLLVFLHGFLRRIAILLAVVVGWAVAGLMDALDLGHAQNAAGDTIDRIAWQTTTPGGKVVTLGDADWFGLPDFTSPSFSFTALLLFLPVVIVLIAENAGHVKAVSEMTGADLDRDLGRAFMGDGAATTLAGAFGGAGTTTYAENIGVMAATRVYSTAAYIVAAFAAILFGLCPKFGVLVGSIPAGVLGGVTIVLYGMIAVLGAKIWVSNRVDFGKTSNLVPAAAGIILGAGDVTLVISDDVSLGGITMGTVVAIVAYHLFRVVKNPEDEATDVVSPTSAHHDEHDHSHGHDQTHRHRADGTQGAV